MLYQYQSLSDHPIYRFQKMIDFIFYKVWCEAPNFDEYDLELFNGHPELKEIMEKYHSDSLRENNKGESMLKGAGKIFYESINKIFEILRSWSPADIDKLKKYYQANQLIESLCNQSSNNKPLTYEILENKSEELTKNFKVFFKTLYSDVIKLKPFTDLFGVIDQHYYDFMEKNTLGICPFCGLNHLKGNDHTRREPYDHYLPEGKYPFISINFNNLFPICHECNSSYKHTKDPISDGRKSRKAFYPYNLGAEYDFDLKLTIKKAVNWSEIKPEHIDITFVATGFEEEIKTWRDLFGIDERYKAKCCSNSSGFYWIQQLLDEWNDEKLPVKEYLNKIRRRRERNLVAEQNFLKYAFLESCNDAGLFTN